MLPTYPATLRAGQLKWGEDGSLQALGNEPVPVHVILVRQPARPADANAAMLAALEAAAAAGAADVFGDPIVWQRETRIDRVMPGREA